MSPLLGFAPDAPRTTDGVLGDCVNFIPYESGMEAAPAPSSTGIDTLAAPAVGGYSWTKLDGTSRTFAASNATRIYDLSGATWTDRSAGGTAYTATNFVTFAPFGTSIVAALGTSTVLQVSSTGAFAAISGAPQAKFCFSVITSGGGFVMAGNTNTNADAWHCSGVNDHTTWTTAIATQANTGRLLGNDSGELTAGIEFGDRPILFKRRTMFVGVYVGGDQTFAFSEVPGGAGCVGPYAVCTVDAGLFFVGPDQLWLYDGARPIPIGDNQVRQWFFNELSSSYFDRVRVLYDRPKNRIRIFYPNQTSAGTCNACLVYHLVTKQWGRDDRTVQHAFAYIQPSITWATVTGTWASTTYTWDSNELNPSARSIAIFNGSNVLQTLTGASESSGFTTEDFGNEFDESFMDEIRLRYATVPLTSSATGYTLDEAGDSADIQLTQASSDMPSNTLNKFDLRQSGRFHRIVFTFTGPCRVVAKQPRLQPAGGR